MKSNNITENTLESIIYKGGDAEKFKQIQEVVTTLMDPIQRHQYDIDLLENNFTFTQDDYDLIYKYYNSFINSVEVRLMTNLFYSVPKHSRSKVNLSSLFKKRTHHQKLNCVLPNSLKQTQLKIYRCNSII